MGLVAGDNVAECAGGGVVELLNRVFRVKSRFLRQIAFFVSNRAFCVKSPPPVQKSCPNLISYMPDPLCVVFSSYMVKV